MENPFFDGEGVEFHHLQRMRQIQLQEEQNKLLRDATGKKSAPSPSSSTTDFVIAISLHVALVLLAFANMPRSIEPTLGCLGVALLLLFLFYGVGSTVRNADNAYAAGGASLVGLGVIVGLCWGAYLGFAALYNAGYIQFQMNGALWVAVSIIGLLVVWAVFDPRIR